MLQNEYEHSRKRKYLIPLGALIVSGLVLINYTTDKIKLPILARSPGKENEVRLLANAEASYHTVLTRNPDRDTVSTALARGAYWHRDFDPFYKLTIKNFTIPDTTSSQRLIFAKLGGGLGNHMFQYAGVTGMARQTNRRVALMDTEILLKHCPRMREHAVVLPSAEFTSRIKDIPHLDIIQKSSCFDSINLDKAFSRAVDKNVKLRGYYESWKYFVNCEDDVKAQFELSGDTRRAAQEHLHRIKARFKNLTGIDTSVFVGIHVRDKTNTSPAHAIDNVLLVDASYFRVAMDLYRNSFENPVFVIISDNAAWVSNHLLGPPDVFLKSTPGSAMFDDFATTVACNHTIRSHGTFGWWVSYLAGGQSVFYYPYKRNTPDFFRPDEIGMDEYGNIMTSQEKVDSLNRKNRWLPKGNLSDIKNLVI